MKFDSVIGNRFSVRKYKDKIPDYQVIAKLLEAGRIAPSAANHQPWFFIVVVQPENLEKLHQVYPRDWFKSAPAAIVFCADHSACWKRPADGKSSSDIDIAIAVDHVSLMATNLGLGSCWVCNFNAELCSEILQLPENIEPLVILPFGYPDCEMPPRKRKPLEEIVRWEKF